MKTLLITITFSFFLLFLSVQAQSYYGVAGAFGVAGSPVFPVGIQGGNTDVLPDFGVRMTLDTALLGSTLGADVLYTPSVETVQFYLGGGPELVFGNAWGVGARATTGLEFRQSIVGFFSEIQPYVGTWQASGIRVRLGLNIYLQN